MSIDGDRLVGREHTVKLAYIVEYALSVRAGPSEHQAIEEAELRRFAEDVDPSERELVHTDVDPGRPIYADDPEACEVADWIDAPSAPSEETYWDDSRHFEDDSP